MYYKHVRIINMFKRPIYYFRRQDFDKQGNLISSYFKDKVVIIFIHANYCMYCHMAKDDYIKAAKMTKNVIFGAIQFDGEIYGEKQCEEIFNKICKDFQGFPEYAIFKNGKPLKIEVKNRDYKTIIDTLKSLE